MRQMLGWVSCLMRYYANTGSIGEITAPIIKSARQAEIAEVTQSKEFALNQILEAKVLKIKGNKVAYEIFGAIKLTEKEQKKVSVFT
jgi:hypothetical protein